MRRFLHSLRSRLVVLVILVALPGVVTLAFQFWEARNHATDSVRERAIDTVRLLASDQARLIAETQRYLERVAQFPEVLQPDSAECSVLLSKVLGLTERYVNLGVPRTDGELRCNALPLNAPVNVADRPYIRRALDGRNFSIGEFQVDRAAGVTSVNFAYPVIDPINDRVVGAAVAVMSLDWWSERLAETQLPEETMAYIADADGRIVAHFPEARERLGMQLGELGIHGAVTTADRHAIEIIRDDDGRTRIFASTYLIGPGFEYPMMVGVGIPIDAQLAEIGAQTLNSSLLLLFFVALMFATAMWGVKVSVVRPLEDLAASTRALESGEHHPPTRFTGALELVTLQEGFARMARTRLDAEAKLKLAASVFTHAREGIFITDADGVIIDANETFSEITGYSRDEVVGQSTDMLGASLQKASYYAGLWSALRERGHWYGEVWNTRKNGQPYAAVLTISAVQGVGDETANYVALLTDITLIKAHEKQLERIAHYDALTNLPNRVLLADRLTQAMVQTERRKRMLAVALLDLDGFKPVNDTYGHGTGDRLLVMLSERMKLALRDGDTLARIGGDEFVAVLNDLESDGDCEIVLKRLLAAVSEPVRVNDLVLRVTASIGVTIFPQDRADADVLIRHADQAMYAAKQAGRNRHHLFDVSHDEAIKSLHERQKQISGALDRREFALLYQPKVNLQTGMVVGLEALIRWRHPERGLLAPAGFLPYIEDHLISVELGEWVLDTALTQLGEWQAEGLNLPVSVNISALQLQQGNFVERLSGILAAHADIDPARLELEILETNALEDLEQVCDLMHACLALGVRFALDDFGTGYSSLTYLKRLPAGVLKIDQSFVRDMLEDPDDLAIVAGVIGLARAFHREVIAEGVESAAHGAKLASLGCVLAQGFGIAHPMSAAAVPEWVRNWRLDRTWRA